MGKVETYTQNRVEGLAWALDLIMGEETVEKGVELLKKEVVFRRATFMPLEMNTKAIDKCDEILQNHMMNSILIAFLKLFEEEYGWRKVRLQRLVEDFAKHTNDRLMWIRTENGMWRFRTMRSILQILTVSSLMQRSWMHLCRQSRRRKIRDPAGLNLAGSRSI